jgi:hypothetical protein
MDINVERERGREGEGAEVYICVLDSVSTRFDSGFGFFFLQVLLLFSNCFFIITLVIRTGISQILNKYLDKFLKNYMNIKD